MSIHPIEHEKGCRVADQVADIISESEAEAYEYPQYADDTHCNKALEHG